MWPVNARERTPVHRILVVRAQIVFAGFDVFFLAVLTSVGFRVVVVVVGEGIAGESFLFSRLGEKLTHSESTWHGRADRWDLAERAAHAGFEFEEFARLNLSFLRLRSSLPPCGAIL